MNAATLGDNELPALPGAWRLTLVPLAAGAAVRVLLAVWIQVLHGNFLFLDDQGYDTIGWSLAQAWHAGIFPSPSSVQYAGTTSDAFYVFTAAAYFAFGHHWILVKLIVALLSALCVPAAASIGVSLGGRRLGIAAAWLAALYPNAVFWGATGLKDGLSATLLLAVAAIALRSPSMRRTLGATVIIWASFLLRPVLGAAGLVMLAAAALGWARRAGTRSRRRVLLVGVPALAAMSWLAADRYLPTLQATLAGTGSLSTGTAPVTISYVPSLHNVLRSLLGPFPWSFGPGADSAYLGLYPGMAVWIVMLPAIALGSWELLRRGTWAQRGVVLAALAFLYVYVAAFQGDGFFRQRYTVEILLLVTGLYAFQRLPHRAALATALGACVIAPAALIQTHALAPAGVALAVLTAGALWLSQVQAARRHSRLLLPVSRR